MYNYIIHAKYFKHYYYVVLFILFDISTSGEQASGQ
jgi:hypothetical protein